MKKTMIVLAVIVLILTLLVGCSQDSGMSDQKVSNDATAQSAEKLVNDNPIKPVKDDTKYAVEYFNQHAYTSDFSYNEAQPSHSYYWVYKEDDELRKVTLDNYITVNGELTLTAGGSLDEVLKSNYLDAYESNRYWLDLTYDPRDTGGLQGMTEDRSDIFYLKIINSGTEACSVQDCVINYCSMHEQGEMCEYMGLHPGDDIDKVIEVLGSPNRELLFMSTKAHEYDIVMRYIDVENERTALVTLHLIYYGNDSEDTKAYLSQVTVFDGLEEDSAH